jgi:hypothetical protein
MANLFSGLVVPSAVTGVKNFVASILDIFVTAGENDGVCAFVTTPRDPCPAWSMEASPGEFISGGEPTTFGIARNVTKNTVYHEAAFVSRGVAFSAPL